MTPSTHIKEIQTDSYERLRKLNHLPVDKFISNGGPRTNVVLEFSPKLLLFQNYTANDKIVAKFQVKNVSQSITYFKMVFKESSYFSIKPSNVVLSKLAPGISVTFTVTFTPGQYEDFIHKVCIFTEAVQYTLPIIALGPRPLFDFPDEVRVASTPLKIKSSCSITVHNIGCVSSGFSLKTNCPFYVTPKSAFLKPGDKTDVQISFVSMHIRKFSGTLIASYETGEQLTIALEASTYPVDVCLENSVVKFIETYVKMSRQQIITIHNRSNHTLSYTCMRYGSVEKDLNRKIDIGHMYKKIKENESRKCRKLVEYEISSCEDHKRVYARIFEDEIQALVLDDTFLFQDTHFSITPLQGTLWPNTSAELTLLFSPEAIGHFEAVAYIDVDGVEGRLPLKTSGESLAPSIKLNVDTLDMDRVYIGRMYNYELVAMNNGHISGVLVHKKTAALFGSTITCTPERHRLESGEKKLFVVSYINANKGPYFEEMHFHILDTDVTLKVYLKGEMVFPTLSFATKLFDFGTVSLGVPKTVEIKVINESTVEVQAVARVLSDGPELNSTALTDYAVFTTPKPDLPAWPKEFQIEPNILFIEPTSHAVVKITLTANLIRANQTSLEVELKDAESTPISLPIRFNALVPQIRSHGDLSLKACFLNHPYHREILFSSNEFTGYFVLETEKSNPAIHISIQETEGYIQLNSVTRIHVMIKTNALGLQNAVVRARLFGLSNPLDICQIAVCGVRPIITYSPSVMIWGNVKLLHKVDKSLMLVNDSPICVDFEASLVNDDGKWNVNLSKGRIEEENTCELILSLYLVDADTYQNKLLIRFENLNDILVPLSATGVGTSIIVGELRDRVVLGRHFTRIPMECEVVMENCGKRMHTLEWSPNYKLAKNKNIPAQLFTLEPSSFKMAAGEKLNLKVTAATSKVTTMIEIWYLIGSIEGINKKELLMKCPFEAEFVDPKIELSTDAIELRYDYGPYSEHYNLTDIFTLKNISTLPLDVEVSVRPPFAFVQRITGYIIDKNDTNLCDCMCYNISDINVEALMRESEPYVCKELIDYLTKKPVPPFRTEYLRFFQEINKLKLAFNLTHIVKEILEDEEAMRLQVVFDTTKHSTLRSRDYYDLIRIKFKKHKNRDALKVTGRINFPNLTITPIKLDFDCIPNGSVHSKSLKIQNITPLTVCFQLQFKTFTYSEPEVFPDESKNKPASSVIESITPRTKSEDEIHEILASRKPESSLIENINAKDGAVAKLKQGSKCTHEIVYSDMHFTTESKESQMLMKTITPILSADHEEPFEWAHKFPIKPQPQKLYVHELFNIFPHRGVLKPGQDQCVHVTFSPKNDVNISTILECEVLGGPSETVTIVGTSSVLKYALNTEAVEFKIRSYHEKATEYLKLLNSGVLPFDYITHRNDTYISAELGAKILEIEPAFKHIEHYDEVDVKITVDPGIIGHFHLNFLLEIGPLEKIYVDILGWGVIPQVHISLPRLHMELIPAEICYPAVSTLTPQFLDTVRKMFKENAPNHLNSPSSDQRNISPELENLQEWYICDESDDYPTVMDIELSLERLLVIDHIKQCPESLKAGNKNGPIHGFLTTPYVIEYGVVIVGTTVTCSANVVNYGPGHTKLFRARANPIPPWLEVKLGARMNPGEVSKFEVIFSPTREDFPEIEQTVETTFFLEVPWGVSIPVMVRATCAVPYLVSNISNLSYGHVRCGDKVVCSIPLKNIGKCTCIWYVTLKLKNHGQNAITILNNSGKYEPDEGGWLDIAFKPMLEMTYEGLLIFKFHMNPLKLTIPVVGLGVLPRVRIIGERLQFPPTLPGSPTSHLYFGLTNPCLFPIELIFARADEKWKEEENIYQILYKYYNKPGEMLVPAIMPGYGLPAEVTDFYRNLMDKVNSAQNEDATSGGPMSARSNTVARKTPKKSAKPSAPKSTTENVIRCRTKAEVIADELALLKKQGADPLKEAAITLAGTAGNTPEDSSLGVLIFAHGSPYTEIQAMELACSIAKKLKLPVVNIDSVIVEALSTTECTARSDLLAVVQEMYETCLKASIGSGKQVEETTEEISIEDENKYDYDTIQKMLNTICTTKQPGTPRSKASADKKRRKSQGSSAADMGGSSLLLPMELLIDLMKEFFSAPRFAEGFVVDNLTSSILKQPAQALTTMLKCKPRVKEVQLMICHSEFSKWALLYEERELQNDQLTTEISSEMNESEVQQLIEEFEEMDASDYENSSPELRQVYVNIGLEERRKKCLENRKLSVGKPVKHNATLKDSTKSVRALELSSTRKLKKDQTESMTATSKKTEIKTSKPTSEYLMMNLKFNEYQKNTFDELMNIANNWCIEDCDLAFPLLSLTGQPVGTTQKKSSKKKISLLDVQVADIEVPDRGFSLKVVTVPCLEKKDALLEVFAHCPLIKAARAPKKQIDILKQPLSCQRYTVLQPKVLPVIENVEGLQLKLLDEPSINKCECNLQEDTLEHDPTTQEDIIHILSMWHCTCGKMQTSPSISTTDARQHSVDMSSQETSYIENYPQRLQSVQSLRDPPSRLVLQAGALVRCKYSFSPEAEGKYDLKRFVEVAGWPDSRTAVTATGMCDVPRLDTRPKKVFCDFVRRTVEDEVYKAVFLDDLKVFEFGPIFIGANRVYEESTNFNMKNSSLMNCDVNFSFLEEEDVFTLENSHINLEVDHTITFVTYFLTLTPGCRDNLKVLAAPSTIGEFGNTLIGTIANNPKIVQIHVSCSGVTPLIEILPASKSIDYGKLLLYRREEERFIVKNDSILPIMWKLRNANELLEHFIVGHTFGVVDSNNNQVVIVTYVASQVGVIINKPLVIDIYDQEGRGLPMLTETLLLAAECYDVLVDCAFEDPEDTSLDYGNVKVNSQVVKGMYFLNRGKYPIFYKIKKVKNFPDPAFLKSIEIIKECGVILPNMRLVDVQFVCTATVRMDLQNVPAFTCSFIDGMNNQIVVFTYPIKLSIASFYNTFTLLPLGELNFHVIPVGVIRSKEIIINNTSKCPFTYEIQLPIAYQTAFSRSSVLKEGRSVDSKKVPVNKGMACGNFTIMNDDSVLAPGASRKIEVQFFARNIFRYEEVINFIVSDTCPSEALGVPLRLVGTGAIPSLDIWNLETTFREHLIIKNLSDSQVRETSPHCIFVENSVTLHFLCVTLHSGHAANIDLFNNGSVAAALTMRLHYQDNSDSSIFYLDKYSTHIEPLVHRNLVVNFTPRALEEYRAILEIRLKLLEDQEDIYQFCLIGEGVIPRIQILEPPFNELKNSSISFTATLTNSVNSKVIRMRNISSVDSTVTIDVVQGAYVDQPPFWLTVSDSNVTESMMLNFNSEVLNSSVKLALIPKAVATIQVCYSPSTKGKNRCDIEILIINNPYEYFTIACEGEGFNEDVTLTGIEMLPMDYEVDIAHATMDLESLTGKESVGTSEGKKKVKSPNKDQKKNKSKKELKKGPMPEGATGIELTESVVIKYVLALGGCELNTLKRRTAVMVNRSQRVYQFAWRVIEHVVVRPMGGYICPGEEKDVEIDFLSDAVVIIDKMNLYCNLVALDSTLSSQQMNVWPSDSRQTITAFEKSRETDVYTRSEKAIENLEPTSTTEGLCKTVIDIVIVFSAIAEYAKYTCSLVEDIVLQDTLMYQTKFFDLEISNIGLVPMKIIWSFIVDEQYPTRIDAVNSDHKECTDQSQGDYRRPGDEENTSAEINNESDVDAGTLYSDENTRASVDTWFEAQLPFIIEPERECIVAGDKKKFRVTFAPKEAFNYKLQLSSFIENLHPEYSNVSLSIRSQSLVPYCHLDTDSDYVTSRRKASLPALPADIRVLEFNVLGTGCYKKNLKIVNPTSKVYRFFLESVPAGKAELVPVHCDTLEGSIPSASSMEVCFTFAPSAATVYESLWKFTIPQHSIELDLLVVGIVREPDVSFIPTIVILNKTLVGDSTVKTVRLCNRENERLSFRFTGNSLSNESGLQPVMIAPEKGTVGPLSDVDINVTYKPIASGNLSFKIFCEISSMEKPLVLCVNALSHLVKPKVTYFLMHHEHELMSDALTNIHIEKIASRYERKIRFVIKNDGSAAFEYEWQYVDSPVKKYMDIYFDPKVGHIEPGEKMESVMYITLRDVPVSAYPLTLNISDGPEYHLYIHVEIHKPLYQFSFTQYDFGKCIVNAPSATYKKNIYFTNNDAAVIVLDLNFANIPEMYVDFKPKLSLVQPKHRIKIPVYFRPNNAIPYEFVLPFYVNSLVENNITIKGEGVPLMFDIYEGCQKSFNLGAVMVGSKIVKEIEVMNHSKVAIEAHLLFVDTYPNVEDDETNSRANSECLSPEAANAAAKTGNVGDGPDLTRIQMLKLDMNARTREQLSMDLQNAISSLKVTPVRAVIKPHHKIPVKIQYKPKGLIQTLNMRLCMKVFNVIKPLVNISGQATGMSLCLSQSSLQFGPVRKHGCKTLKIMLFNKGDIGTKFFWQPLRGADFSITPMEGISAPRTTVTFSISFKPNYNNPFIKTWVICNIENYHSLELALYGSCLDLDNYEAKNLTFDCSVRESETVYVNITNQSDDSWEVLATISGLAFETLNSFTIDPHSNFEVPIYFKPRTMGEHEGNVLYSPLGENSLYFTLSGTANSPEPNGICELDVLCKESFTQNFLVYHLTVFPETYIVQTEVLKTTPDDFTGYYELNFPKIVKVWGEAAATCRWTIVIYDECIMHLKVMFINQETREYQLYYVVVTVKPSRIVGTIELTTRARESVQSKITVKNPLSEDLPFLLDCSNEYVTFENQVIVSRKSETQCIITYSPLVTGVKEELLEAGHPLVGVFIYKLLLTCLAAKEKTYPVSTPLGVSITMRLAVQNKTDAVANFICTTTNTSFNVETNYSLGPNEKGKFLTFFEPTNIGPQTGQIRFTSQTAGDFVYNIEGIATDPKPLGPIEIKAGTSTAITFTNVFEDTRTFKILVDRDEFSVKSIFETVKPKKEVKIAVFLSQMPLLQPENVNPTGCLTIQCHEPAEPKVIWTYFLQGL